MATPAKEDAEDPVDSSRSSSHSPEGNAEKRHAVSRWNTQRRALTKRKKVVWIAVPCILVAIALALGLGLGLGLRHRSKGSQEYPIVDLGYAQYQGSNSSGIARFLGMRYAAAPEGHLRFAAPASPQRMRHVQPATQIGQHQQGHSEDCLFIEVYAPGNATSDSKLPVYVYLQGGGFVENPGSYNGAPLIKASGMQLIVVNLNYRVGPHGFLASEEIRKGGSFNNGLKDQRQALRWIKEHISKFGGDPDHVVLGGSSAGAASITLQLAAYGGRDEGLFHATAAESQSFGALRTVSESQYQYDELVARTKCDQSSDTLACLRKLSSSALQSQNIGTPFPNTTQRPLFAYNPTLDYDFIPANTLSLFATGRFVKLPAIYGDATNEGTVFASRALDTPEESTDWMQAQFPRLNNDQKDWFLQTYPPVPETWPKTGKYWRSTADAYGELRYVCPGMFLNNVYQNHSVKGNWNYRYAVLDPGNEKVGLGTPHVSELNAIWGAPAGSPASYKTTNANMIPVLQQYWISFIRTFDPNTHRLEGTPRWEEWGASSFDSTGQEKRRILFQNGDGKRTEMETVDGRQWERCRTLSGWAVGLRQ